MKPIFMHSGDFLELLFGKTGKNSCIRKVAKIAQIPNQLNEWFVWDMEVMYGLFSGNKKEETGYLGLDTSARDEIGLGFYRPFKVGLPGFTAEEGRYECNTLEELRKYLQETNPQIKMTGPIIRTSYAQSQCPSMIMDPTSFLEIHTEQTSDYCLIAVQGFHPKDKRLRQKKLEEGVSILHSWGIDSLVEEKALERPTLKKRNFDLGQIIKHYEEIQPNRTNYAK